MRKGGLHLVIRCVQALFGDQNGFVRGPFGVRSGSVRAPFGPILDQNFRSQKFKISKIFNLCGRRGRGGGPPGSGARDGGLEGPRRGGDGRTI